MSQQINLVNPDFRKKRVLFTAVMLLQMLAAVLLIMVGASAYQYRQVQALTGQAKDGAVQLTQEQDHLLQVAAEYAPRPKDPVLEKKVADLEALLKGEAAVLDELQGGKLGNTEGYSGYMRAFARQAVNGLWLTGFNIQGAGADMAISGRTLRAELVPAYILRLNQEPVTHGYAFDALEMQLPKEQPATQDKPAMKPNYLEFKLHSNPPEHAK